MKTKNIGIAALMLGTTLTGCKEIVQCGDILKNKICVYDINKNGAPDGIGIFHFSKTLPLSSRMTPIKLYKGTFIDSDGFEEAKQIHHYYPSAEWIFSDVKNDKRLGFLREVNK